MQMNQRKSQTKDFYNSFVYRYDTPQGTAYVEIWEQTTGEIKKVILRIGKSGSAIQALCSGISELASKHFEKGMAVAEVISLISGITSDNYRKINGMKIHGPIDALVISLLLYRNSIPDELEAESLGKHLRARR